MWYITLMLLVVQTPKRRVVRRRNLARSRVTTMSRTSVSFWVTWPHNFRHTIEHIFKTTSARAQCYLAAGFWILWSTEAVRLALYKTQHGLLITRKINSFLKRFNIVLLDYFPIWETCYHDRLRRLGLWTLQERPNRTDLLEVGLLKLKADLLWP